MSSRSKLIIFGAGKIGRTVADLMDHTGDYEVTLVDRDDKALEGVTVGKKVVDASNAKALEEAMAGHDFVLSALPFNLTKNIAVAAKNQKLHYFDLTEDVATSDFVRDLARDADTAFVPQSGLAPGFISIAAHEVSKKFETIESLQMRVGALAKYPTNAIRYNLTWSTAGLVNEYIHPCNALIDGEMVKIPALDGYETFILDGVEYEAFNTSGGLGTLAETLKGKAKSLTYKSIRYPGHHEIMKTLLQGLKLRERPDLLIEILENAIPATKQDAVLVFVNATGYQKGRLMKETYVTKVYARDVNGKHLTAIQVTTASSVCAMIDMVREGVLPQKGFVKQEDVSLDTFKENRFGIYYKEGEWS